METKSRILYLYKILSEKTDDLNPMDTKTLMVELSNYGIEVTRRTIISDLALLEEFGVDIIMSRHSQNLYHIGSRDFELSEVKLLIDAIISSKLVTPKKSKVLISKLSKMVSITQSEELQKRICIERRVKPQNEEVYYSIDAIHSAISENKQILFKIIEYNQNKERTLKHDGLLYKVSPYALVWNDDHYYVIGYCEKHKGISQFRVDRLTKVNISKRISVNAPKDFDVTEYINKVFDMYDGQTQTVELKCENQLMKIIIDRFGQDVKTEPLGSFCFKATVDVSVSPTFFGWIFQFGGKINVISPNDVRVQYSNMIKQVSDKL